MLERVRNYVKTNLSPLRARHVFAVEQLMLQLAAGLALPNTEVSLAALGHDLARELPAEILLWLAETEHLPLEPWEQQNPMLLHGAVAAPLLCRLVGQVPTRVKLAAKQHTLGDRCMDPLAQLLFCADYLEPNREHLAEIRRTQLLSLPLAEMFAQVARESCAYHQQFGPLLPPSQIMLDGLCR